MADQKQRAIGVIEVLILIGFASFFAYYYLLTIGFPADYPSGESQFIQRMVQLSVFAGLLLGAFFALHHSSEYSVRAYKPSKTMLWGIMGCVPPALVMLEANGITVSPVVCAFVSVAAGFGTGYFLVGWEDLSSRARIADILVSIGVSVICGLALSLVVMVFMPPMARGVMSIVFMLVNAVLFFDVGSRRDRSGEMDEEQATPEEIAAERDKRLKEREGTFSMRMSALLLIASLPLGYLLPLLYALGNEMFYIGIAVAICFLAAFVVVMKAAGKTLTFVMLLRICIGACAFALLLPAMSDSLLLVCCIILFAVWLTIRLAHSSMLIRLTRVQKVSPVYLIVRGKIPGYIGFILGFIFNNVVYNLTQSDTGVIAGGLMIVAVLIVGSLVLFPFSESYDRQLAMVPLAVDVRTSSAEEIELAKCAEIAKRYSLSPREEEILLFIVRGRNARFIAEKLVISESTAKTHIHNIYKKSGIHSQQKFIDLMDELG